MALNLTLYLNLLNLISRQNDVLKPSYDYIIVGSGSGGATLANRLTEDGRVDVLLLEAGGYPPEQANIPIKAAKYGLGSSLSWVFPVEPNGKSCLGARNQTCLFSAGKSVGGSSQINSMLYSHGNRVDYDLWEANGARGWGFHDVLPYFKKAEGVQIPRDAIDEGYHGENGPLTVSHPNYVGELRDSYLAAVNETGHPLLDFNGRVQQGFGVTQATLRDGYRCGTEKAYLRPAYSRRNLRVVTRALVTKIDISSNKVARRVFFVTKNGKTYNVLAKREVIISAGAIKSPQILMLSGIGPKNHLEKLKIPVLSDLPVGQNLQDHVTCLGNTFTVEGTNMPTEMNLLIYNAIPKLPQPDVLTGETSSPYFTEVMGHVKSPYEKIQGDYNDLQLDFVSMSSGPQSFFNLELMKYYLKYVKTQSFTMIPSLLHPASRGSVTLNSTDPKDKPKVFMNYLSDPKDVEVLVYAMKKIREIVNSKALSRVKPRMIGPVPGCERFQVATDKYFRCLARTLTISAYHACCTCKMGQINDPTTVVDDSLRVKGIKRLRVVDASIMPTSLSANTNAPTIMIAEKAADIIKKQWNLYTNNHAFRM